MQKTYAQRLEYQFQVFFDDFFPRKFNYYQPKNQNDLFAYYRNFSSIGISLVIFLPLYINNLNELSVLSDRKIKVLLKTTAKSKSPYLVELTHISLYGTWRDRLHERIDILWELLETQIYKCQKCDVYMIPKTCRTRDKKRTQFVTLQCPKCYKYKSTEYGMGFKTILHRNLRKKRSH